MFLPELFLQDHILYKSSKLLSFVDAAGMSTLVYISGLMQQVFCRDKDWSDQACTQIPRTQQAGCTMTQLTVGFQVGCDACLN